MADKVRDLRSALERLKTMEGQYIETDVEVDPMAELAGVYRYVGAGGTVKRPTKEGPAMVFNNVKGHKDARVAIGVLASRKRVAALLDCKPEELGKKLYHSVDNPIPPVEYQGYRIQSSYDSILRCTSISNYGNFSSFLPCFHHRKTRGSQRTWRL